MLTDEQVIDAYLEEPSMRKAATRIGISNEALSARVSRMRLNGVKVPLGHIGRTSKYTPERVEQLNDYIQQHTRHS